MSKLSGAPKGNQNAKKAKVWTDAIERVLAKRNGTPGLELEKLAGALIDKALEGDMIALKEIGDRLEGKPVQQQILSGDPDNPLAVTEIVRKIIK